MNPSSFPPTHHNRLCPAARLAFLPGARTGSPTMGGSPFTPSVTEFGTRPGGVVAVLLVMTFVVVGLTVAIIAPPTASADTTSPICSPTVQRVNWRTAVTDARTTLAAVKVSLAQQRFAAAETQLQTLRHRVRLAHTAATALIGRPPADPESDEPPGPAAVQGVAGLEHQVTMQLVPLVEHIDGRSVGQTLGNTIVRSDSCRHVMLNDVIALSAGKRDDYVDGLSDTMPSYDAELTRLASGLATYDLTASERASLVRIRDRVAATKAAMEPVFGGGERPSRKTN